MSIAPARRVSTSASSSRVEKNYGTGSRTEQFVEIIDTNNNILVRDDPEHNASGQNPRHEKEAETFPETAVTPSVPYVNNSIEALAVSGVFNEETIPGDNNKVNIYDANQSIIKDEELDRTGRNYLKHFYEKNEHLKEIDELI